MALPESSHDAKYHLFCQFSESIISDNDYRESWQILEEGTR
jgi:hypothetical protein